MASGVNFFCSCPVTVKWATKCQLSAMHFLVFTAEEVVSCLDLSCLAGL